MKVRRRAVDWEAPGSNHSLDGTPSRSARFLCELEARRAARCTVTHTGDMGDITTHVLDTSLGRPAENMVVTLAVWARDEWHKLGEGRTDIEGQIHDLLPTPLREEGMYRLRFAVADYYAHINTPTLYPFIDIVFDVLPGLRYHVPLLVSPFGYTTYRGS